MEWEHRFSRNDLKATEKIGLLPVRRGLFPTASLAYTRHIGLG